MSRSPLAYPLTRSVDGDAGGAADLQTDIMRFMAILSLCLVAIFALVQSLPMAPEPSATPVAEAPQPIVPEEMPEPREQPVIANTPPIAVASPTPPRAVAMSPPAKPATTPAREPTPQHSEPAAPAAPAAPPEPRGFTLRFASDRALTRLVARGDIGFYAIRPGGAARLSVRESRLNFWEAPVPAAFHEMERSTVPDAVLNALQGSNGSSAGVRWGVTLPKKLKQDLDQLMREHSDGALVIDAAGALHREAS